MESKLDNSCRAQVLDQNEVSTGIFLIRFKCETIAARARPGQFVHVQCGNGYDPLLRRPFSFHRIAAEDGWFELLYRVAGKGTKLLTLKQPGDTVNVLGPLGTGFDTNADSVGGNPVLLVAGGMGIAPMLALAEEVLNQKRKLMFFLGAGSAGQIPRLDALAELGVNVRICTDDGSTGRKALVTEDVEHWLREQEAGKRFPVFGCGPQPMLQALQQLCRTFKLPLQIAVEERMACGIGACLSCVCRTSSSQLAESEWKYVRVCKEGPVFSGDEVVFDE